MKTRRIAQIVMNFFKACGIQTVPPFRHLRSGHVRRFAKNSFKTSGVRCKELGKFASVRIKQWQERWQKYISTESFYEKNI